MQIQDRLDDLLNDLQAKSKAVQSETLKRLMSRSIDQVVIAKETYSEVEKLRENASVSFLPVIEQYRMEKSRLEQERRNLAVLAPDYRNRLLNLDAKMFNPDEDIEQVEFLIGVRESALSSFEVPAAFFLNFEKVFIAIASSLRSLLQDAFDKESSSRDKQLFLNLLKELLGNSPLGPFLSVINLLKDLNSDLAETALMASDAPIERIEGFTKGFTTWAEAARSYTRIMSNAPNQYRAHIEAISTLPSAMPTDRLRKLLDELNA
jgi:hypothetical protein